MKYLFTTLFLLLLQGCSYKNAYTFFQMDKEEELYETNTLNAKIQLQSEVLGILSVTYLNDVDKNLTTDDEQFLVSIFLKEKQRKYNFTLNGKKPLKIKKITKEGRYTKLLAKQSQWSQDSIVTFEKSSNDLNLTFYTYPSILVPMNFLKEQ